VVYEYPVDLQDCAVQSSSMMPVLVYIRKTIKGTTYNYNNSYYSNRTIEPDRHTPVDVASCFWVDKGCVLTQLDVMKKMHSTIRHAVDDERAVDDIVAEMESGGNSWRSTLHVSVLGRVADGISRSSFPSDSLVV
jgi:hypothetical protein